MSRDEEMRLWRGSGLPRFLKSDRSSLQDKNNYRELRRENLLYGSVVPGPPELLPDLRNEMSESVWKFEHSVESEVPQEFAWGYWSDVRNWEDPPAKLEWDGPFRVGARLTTILPGQRLESVVRQIEEGRGARIEMEVMGATVTFEWRFEEVAERRTKITQTICLSGPGAEKLVDQAKVLEQSAPEGMKRLARTMERSWMEKAC